MMALLKTTLILSLAVTGLSAQTPAEIDWKRVVDLREKDVRGTALSDEERKYLTRSLAILDPTRQSAIATRLALAGLTGDGAGEVFQAPPVRIGLDQSPVEVLQAKASDGRVIEGSYRKPHGDGPFPAVLIIHGGLDSQRPEKQRWFLTEGPVHTRLLQAGYVVVQGTFRRYDPQDLLKPGPTLDVEALYLETRRLPFVAADSVALFGGSGGGSLALEVAARHKPAAVLTGEPATILFAGMLKTGEYEPRLQMMGNPWAYYKDEHRQLMEAKLRKIRSPLLIFSGDIHPLKIMNGEILLPAVRKAGIDVTWLLYPGEGHGFYFGSATAPPTVEKVIRDATGFLRRHMSAKAKPFQP